MGNSTAVALQPSDTQTLTPECELERQRQSIFARIATLQTLLGGIQESALLHTEQNMLSKARAIASELDDNVFEMLELSFDIADADRQRAVDKATQAGFEAGCNAYPFR